MPDIVSPVRQAVGVAFVFDGKFPDATVEQRAAIQSIWDSQGDTASDDSIFLAIASLILSDALPKTTIDDGLNTRQHFCAQCIASANVRGIAIPGSVWTPDWVNLSVGGLVDRVVNALQR